MLAALQDNILLTSGKTFRNFHRKQAGGQALELLCSKKMTGGSLEESHLEFREGQG